MICPVCGFFVDDADYWCDDEEKCLRCVLEGRLTRVPVKFGYCGCTFYTDDKIGLICERCGNKIRKSNL